MAVTSQISISVIIIVYYQILNSIYIIYMFSKFLNVEVILFNSAKLLFLL